MIILLEEAQVEGGFDLFGDSANLDARLVHALHGTYHTLRNPFGRTPIELLDDMCIWNLALFCLETELVLVQDRYTVCA